MGELSEQRVDLIADNYRLEEGLRGLRDDPLLPPHLRLRASEALSGVTGQHDRQHQALVRAAIQAVALLDVAIAGTVFTKPDAGRVVVNVAKAQAVLDALRAAVSEAEHG